MKRRVLKQQSSLCSSSSDQSADSLIQLLSAGLLIPAGHVCVFPVCVGCLQVPWLPTYDPKRLSGVYSLIWPSG